MNTISEQYYEFDIDGMSCSSCVGRVERALKKIDGIKKADVNLATNKAYIETTVEILPEIIIQAIQKVGYQATLIPPVSPSYIELNIQNMSCASCVGRVERALKKVDGVLEVNVNLATESAQLTVVPNLEIIPLLQTLDQAGYPATLKTTDQLDNALNQTNKHQQEIQQLQKNVLFSVVLALPVFLLEMGGHLIPAVHHWIHQNIGIQNSWLLQFVLASLVLFTAGQRFYRLGIPALFRGAPDMNSLVAVGTLAAYSYSIIATFLPELLPSQSIAVYYESAVVIVVLILLGRLLEAKAKGKTSDAIQHLLNLQPQTAHLIKDQKIIDVDVNKLQCNDIIIIKPGEKIPNDGIIIEGQSYIDESMMTGESIAVAKNINDTVIGGTLNQHGSLHVRITATGQHTVLSQIIRMVERAQGSKLPIQTLIDQITLWFVPIIMGLALLTFILWYVFSPVSSLSLALVNAVAVLIIACPCAMGLATPTSIMIGTGRAAEMGVLFKNGEALQKLKDVKAIAFDKTGTLTQGKPVLSDFIVEDQNEHTELLQLAISLEALSEHPIAKALLKTAEEQKIELLTIENFQAFVGFGIQGEYQGKILHIGAQRFLTSLNISTEIFHQQSQLLEQNGKTPLYLSVNHQVKAVIAVQDQIKPDTKKAIELLHQQGFHIAMISGDNKTTAQAIAQQLGIDEVIAEVLPHQKVESLQKLQQKYASVAFVGDGINDAPALASADIGIAIGTGADIAVESADVILMAGNITGVHTAIRLSQATIRNIKQNLFWAFAYNVALIPVAMGILYPFTGLLLSPMFAAGAMAMSSIFVLTNALRLRKFAPT